MALARLAGLAAPLLRSRSMAGVDSRPVCSGGSITEYVGDGVNGTLGQRYRVHTFTANGTLNVQRGGDADVLLIGGGSCSRASSSLVGGGGQAQERRMTLRAGALPIIVGTGGASGSTDSGTPSSIDGFTTGASGWTFSGLSPAIGAGMGADGGRDSRISGALVSYGKGNQGSPRANRGDGGAGGDTTAGTAGIVIIRYEI